MDVLTINDLLSRYKIGRQSLWRWRRKHGFPSPISPLNARPFWRKIDIEAWESSNIIAA